MRTAAIALFMVVTCGAALADVEALDQFLRSVEEASQATVPLRGDGQLEIIGPDTNRRDQVAIIVRPPSDMYIELHQQGVKVLLLNHQEKAYSWKPGDTKAEEMPLTASFAGTDFTREDLEPFRLSRYQDRRISDDTGSELMVTLYPSKSQYSLLVVTFDRQKKVPLKTQYYRETGSNLVKLRRDSGHVEVASRWVPTTISMETFKLRVQTTFTLQWTQNPTFPPELFDPAHLPQPSGLVWPATGTNPTP